MRTPPGGSNNAESCPLGVQDRIQEFPFLRKEPQRYENCPLRCPRRCRIAPPPKRGQTFCSFCQNCTRKGRPLAPWTLWTRWPLGPFGLLGPLAPWTLWPLGPLGPMGPGPPLGPFTLCSIFCTRAFIPFSSLTVVGCWGATHKNTQRREKSSSGKGERVKSLRLDVKLKNECRTAVSNVENHSPRCRK